VKTKPRLHGTEWIIDAQGCDPAALGDLGRLRALFEAIIGELALTPVGDPVWHRFPAPGGITGFVVLAESHLACDTFPEFGAICVMPRPAPGFLSAAGRSAMQAGHDGVFYAHSDVSGLPLFEEAQYRGVLAAEQAMTHLG
jgi:S-adenosylmethionine decarboxylase